MSDVNTATVEGHLGSDPKVFASPDGSKMARLSVASNEHYSDRAGDLKEKTQWITVGVYDKFKAEYAEKNFHKGSHVLIQGRLETRTWEQDGQNRSSMELAVRPYSGMLKTLDVKPKMDAEPAPTDVSDIKQVAGTRPQRPNGYQPKQQ